MNEKDPKSIALQFGEYINYHDAASLAALMSDNHSFIDRDNNIINSKENVINAWINFFKMFPDYKNIFSIVKSTNDLVIFAGYAYWSEENKYDPAIWTAKV
jgi:predicted SnoaL-like aldol condensation-catalyzing enzyme